MVAARQGVPDPDGNFQLRFAIDKAKAAGVPKDNIERAIAKGAGQWGNEAALDDVRYEGYGPGGVAVLIEALTDNRNRTAADLRSAFSKNGGNLGETGCVSWMFSQKGVITLAGPIVHEEAFLEDSLDAEAESYGETLGEDDRPIIEITTALESLNQTAHSFKAKGYTILDAGLRWIPNTTSEVTDPDQAKALLKLMDVLDELDDVQTATANFDMADALMESLG